jgi:glycosyltransferase involved in cell wall biosynthesis
LAQPSSFKVLLVAPPAEGGLAEHVLSLLRHLDGNRFSLSLACPSGPPAKRAADTGLVVHNLAITSAFNPLKILRLAIRLRGLIRKERPDILHAHSWSAGVTASLAVRLLRRRPHLICTIHNYPAKGRLAQKAVGLVVGTAKRIICVSHDLTRLADDAHKAKVEVIFNGIEIPDSYPSREELREQLGLPVEAHIVGTVARFAHQKGLAILLEAAVRVKQAHFAVIGDGPLKPELQTRSQRLGLEGRFHFLGSRPHAGTLLPAFDLVAIPSISEGLPLVALEAMAASRPVVASRLGGLQEVIVEGENGLLVAPGEAEELARAISRLLQDSALSQRMGEAGRRRAREAFTLERMLQQTAALYQNLISSQQGENARVRQT